MSVSSKAFNWDAMDHAVWQVVADELIPAALRWKDKGEQTVLDLGCGIGRHALFLAELGFRVTAVDLSPEGIAVLREETARKNLAGSVDALVCDMLALPFEPQTFDCVVAFHSVYHTDLQGLQSVVRTIGRILRDDGEVFLTFNSKRNPAFRDESNRRIDDHTIVKTQGFEKGIPHTYLDYEDILELLGDFTINKIQQIQSFYNNRSGWHYFVEAQRSRK